MSLTKLENLINPEVLADMISAELPQLLRFAPIADIDTTLVGQPGNTITVPKYAYIGMAEDVAEGEEIGSAQLQTSTTQATVKKAGKAVDITDESVLSGYGDPVSEAERQLKMAIRDKIDYDCLTVLADATLEHNAGAKISYNGIVDAIDLFDEEENEPKVLFVNPKQVTALRKDANFQDMNKYPLPVIMKGQIGEICNCYVVPSKRIKLNAEGTAYENYIVKAGALKVYLKRDVQVETGRDIKKKINSIVVDEHYTAHLYDESKVIKAYFNK
ncbi:N4-gp56 family major capsid protein [Clostridium chrysemydis]|uniref:N4-gp56 family major capsid protein n=1 Tax=Clostridium chrysemydis TaxID=2665504 RepID=UPI0018845EF6|nr:N4-gp56 family major capsid protein [Clostridium chrysemydis]